MKSQIDGVDVLILQAWEYELLKHDIPSAILDDDLKKRLEWVWTHKVEQVKKRFKEEWIQKLMDDPAVTELPATDEALFNVVKVRPDYKDRDARDAE